MVSRRLKQESGANLNQVSTTHFLDQKGIDWEQSLGTIRVLHGWKRNISGLWDYIQRMLLLFCWILLLLKTWFLVNLIWWWQKMMMQCFIKRTTQMKYLLYYSLELKYLHTNLSWCRMFNYWWAWWILKEVLLMWQLSKIVEMDVDFKGCGKSSKKSWIVEYGEGMAIVDLMCCAAWRIS